MGKAKCWFELYGRSSRPNIFALSPPVSVGLVGVGAVFWGCTPGKPSLPELVRHFPVLPPGTHGFAGGAVHSTAGQPA